jgi:cell division protein FtsW
MRLYKQILDFDFDWSLIFIFFVIIGVGLVTLASASFSSAQQFYGNEFYFIYRQFLAILIGLGCLTIALMTPIETLEKYSGCLLIIALVLLILVFVPGVGQKRNGSWRWINLGIVSLQPSELSKVFLGIYFCSYAYRHHVKLRTISGLLRPLLVLLLSIFLLLMEPDYGSFIVMSVIVSSILYVGGARYSHIICLLTTLIAAGYYLAFSEAYRVDRISSFLDPWADPLDTGFQLTQSLMAIGSGGFLGLGLGNSIQKLAYLPEAHTDFIFSVFAEEFGFIGCSILIALFSFLIFKILKLSNKAFKQNQHFHGLISFFLAAYLGSSFLLNIAVAIGLVPTKGLTLPFFSYGRSSLIVSIFCIGIILRVSHEVSKYHGVMGARKAYRQTLIGGA